MHDSSTAPSSRHAYSRAHIPVTPEQLEELTAAHGRNFARVALTLGCTPGTLRVKISRSTTLKASYECGKSRWYEGERAAAAAAAKAGTRSRRDAVRLDPARLEELAATHGNNKYDIARGLGCASSTLWLKLRDDATLRAAFERGLVRAGVTLKPTPASVAEDTAQVFSAIRAGAETFSAIQEQTGLNQKRQRAALYTLEREVRAIASRQNERSITRYEAVVEALPEARPAAAAAAAPKCARAATDDAGRVMEAIAAGQRTVSEIMAYTELTNSELRRALEKLEGGLLVRTRYERGMLQHFYLASEGRPRS